MEVTLRRQSQLLETQFALGKQVSWDEAVLLQGHAQKKATILVASLYKV